MAAVVEPRGRQAAAREVPAQLEAASTAAAVCRRQAAVAVTFALVLDLGRLGNGGGGGLFGLCGLGGGDVPPAAADLLGVGVVAVVGLGCRGERRGTGGRGRLAGLQPASDGAEAVLLACKVE